MSQIQCESCGGEQHLYAVRVRGQLRFFDRYDCAVAGLKATCAHCETLLVGMPLRRGLKRYCSEACAAMAEPFTRLGKVGANRLREAAEALF